jgi:hypothetical protein
VKIERAAVRKNIVEKKKMIDNIESIFYHIRCLKVFSMITNTVRTVKFKLNDVVFTISMMRDFECEPVVAIDDDVCDYNHFVAIYYANLKIALFEQNIAYRDRYEHC